MARRARWLGAGLLALAQTAGAACAWPDWEAFKQAHLSTDGRVIDTGSPQQATVSEGQAYAMFFALAAGDRETFERVLAWTADNLAQGDLTTRLPAWIWGRKTPESGGDPSGLQAQWGVLDDNPASDADMWIAYALLEAGRLWREDRYGELGQAVARNIAARETAVLPGLGRTVLPGPYGFQITESAWRLNPSYVPRQVVLRLAAAVPEWKPAVDSSLRLVTGTAPRGYAPDWVEYHHGPGFRPDAQTGAVSAYNAIRVYLWAGLLAPQDPRRAAILRTFSPLAEHVQTHGAPPETVDTRTGAAGPNDGNAGFSAAVAPYLAALGRADLAQAQARRTRAMAREAPLGYYSSVLALFGLGFLDGFYRFDAAGRLQPAWTRRCPAAVDAAPAPARP